MFEFRLQVPVSMLTQICSAGSELTLNYMPSGIKGQEMFLSDLVLEHLGKPSHLTASQGLGPILTERAFVASLQSHQMSSRKG
ncbi:glycosyl hydrolase family 45 [Colletotrichum scovillei]|nr:glycosyl hydrolase family 45 [Colletotrichum scovillei]